MIVCCCRGHAIYNIHVFSKGTAEVATIVIKRGEASTLFSFTPKPSVDGVDAGDVGESVMRQLHAEHDKLMSQFYRQSLADVLDKTKRLAPGVPELSRLQNMYVLYDCVMPPTVKPPAVSIEIPVKSASFGDMTMQ